MITPMDIAADAIKIGLGAIIAGIVTILLTRHNMKKDRAEHKRDLLETVSKQAAIVDRVGLEYWHRFKWVSQEQPDAASAEEHLISMNPRIDEANEASTSVHATLCLLGEEKCDKVFDDYENAMYDYPKKFPISISEEEYQKTRDMLREKRREFRRELAGIYRKV